MNIAFRALTTSLVGIGLLAGSSAGCTATVCAGDEYEDGDNCISLKSMKKFGGKDTIVTADWSSGDMIEVRGNYGNITVKKGTEGEVEFELQPFKYWAHDASESKVKQEAEDNLEYKLKEEDGRVYLSTGRKGGGNVVGADIVVRIPPEFDGKLKVENESDGPLNPGDIDVQFVGSATSVRVATDDLGDCEVDGNTTVTKTSANCDGAITISGVADVVEVKARGLQTGTAIDLSVASVAEGIGGSKIEAEDGDVNVALPASASFIVKAWTEQRGAVNEGALPRDECNVQEAEGRSKTISCGTGDLPTYDIVAGTDCVGECDINLAYR